MQRCKASESDWTFVDSATTPTRASSNATEDDLPSESIADKQSPKSPQTGRR